MEENDKEIDSPSPDKKISERNEVYVKRDLKEYLGESLLIIFSVLLALILTEVFNKIHENQQTEEILKAVRIELMENKKNEEEQYQYHLKVLKNIDSALANPAFERQIITNGILHDKLIIPDGVLRHDLNDVAWQAAKQTNIISKIDLSTYSLLTDIYDNQQRITNSEVEIAQILLSRESRTASDNRVTLILLRDSYHGWTVDRAPSLLIKYQHAIDKLGNL